MSNLIHQFARPSRAVRRLLAGRRRRGSVLILCVVLIVVLALIGTAMLSSTRIDRYTSQQHSYNTQIDLLVEGAKQIARAELAKDLYDALGTTAVYRPVVEQSVATPPPGGTPVTDYDHFDAYHIPDLTLGTPVEPYDAWLASLVPRRIGSLPTDPIFWDAITGPLASDDFEAPDAPAGTTYSVRNHLVPWFKTFSYPDGTQLTFPALRPIDPTTGMLGAPILAADTDGDGMADALLSRMLPGELNGVAWYVAMRIVDNAAKINVNTAFSQQFDFDGSGVLPADRFTRYFTGSIGLMEMLQTYPTAPVTGIDMLGDEMVALNEARMNGAPFPTGLVNGPGTPIDDSGAPRTDFAYSSLQDALHMGLGRRFHPSQGSPSGNPGHIDPANSWQPYSINNMTSLAAGFTLLKPEASRTRLETDLGESLYDHAANGPMGPRSGRSRYAANEVVIWYEDNFNYDPQAVGPPFPNTADFKPLRALLATHNPVSNWGLQHNMTQTGAGSLSPTGVPDVNKTPDLTGVADLMPDYGVGAATRTVAKTNVNTAKFGELWRAYWNVMVDQQTDVTTGEPYNGGTAFTTSPAGIGAYRLVTWWGNQLNADDVPPLPAEAPDHHPQHMFRSSLRDIRPLPNVFFPPYQQLLLRSAIAAANTEDLRDSDNIPTQRDITLTAIVEGAPQDVRVSVYGIEKQPFFTEVYVNTTTEIIAGLGANPKGYVAIELYNPYDEEIDISGWCLAIIDRRDTVSSGETPPNPYPNTGGGVGMKGLSYHYIHAGPPGSLDNAPPIPPWRIPAGIVVPARGFIVFDNIGASGDPNVDANIRPQLVDPPSTVVPVPNLHWVIRDADARIGANKEGRGGELVLLRPVGTALPPASDPPGLENGNVQPIDSFDFTGVISGERVAEVSGGPQYMAWRYRRSVAPAGAPDQPTWKFVYPGRYDGTRTFGQRHQGTNQVLWEPPWDMPPEATEGLTLGEAHPDASYATVHTIQLANDDWPGPHAVPAVPRNQAPFGGFARNGDILKVTFIGSYRVAFDDDRNSVLELNPVTMDSCFANDSDAHRPGAPMWQHNDELVTDETSPLIESREQVGRFVPLRDAAGEYDDLDPVGDFNTMPGTPTNKWRYRWAIDLFEYLTVQSPGNDYLPDVPTTTPPYVPQREPVSNSGGPAASVDIGGTPGIEDQIPIHGLININTAPAKVLSAIPWLPLGDNWDYNPATETWSPTGNGLEDNFELATALVLWRDGAPPTATLPGGASANGPFKSLFDLYRVPAFANLQDAIITQTGLTGGPDDIDGDFSPLSAAPGVPSPDSVRFDFEETNLLLTKVSNLITTRSDSFTVYILVQGWRNVGTNAPELVAQRRVAFIQDRSPVNPQRPALPPPVNVPNE